MLRYFDKIWWKVCFGMAGQGGVVGFVIIHQGAELLGVKGEKIDILAIYEHFDANEGYICGKKVLIDCKRPSRQCICWPPLLPTQKNRSLVCLRDLEKLAQNKA